MATLVFRLRNVPDDEADDVRSLLDGAGIDWYETAAGNWGIAMPGLWVADSDDSARVRGLIDDYQRARSARAIEAGIDPASRPGFIKQLQERPLAVLAIIAFCGFVLYASVNPFLKLVTISGS